MRRYIFSEDAVNPSMGAWLRHPCRRHFWNYYSLWPYEIHLVFRGCYILRSCDEGGGAGAAQCLQDCLAAGRGQSSPPWMDSRACLV